MIDHNFFTKITDTLSTEEISQNINTELYIPASQKSVNISSVNSLENAKKNEISFLANDLYLQQIATSNAGACIISKKIADKIKSLNPHLILLLSNNPYYDFARTLKLFYKYNNNDSIKISPQANISKTAIIGKNCTINPGVFIGENATIGDNVIIGANSTINNNVQIGNNSKVGSNTTIEYAIIGNEVIIHNSVSIGQDGFGFATNEVGHYKVLQLGKVIIHDDVEIGSNCAIDRGNINDTIIGHGTKIDNLVQIAHNVQIGKHCFIAGQCGIAGSTIIGDYVAMGGQVGVAGHLNIGSFNRFAAQSGITKNIASNSGDFYGMPAISKKEWQSQQIAIRKLIKSKK